MSTEDANTPPLLLDLLRHGQPKGGTKLRGRCDDALSEQGWEQLRGATTVVPLPWEAVVSSPLQRCRAFAEAFAQQEGLQCRVEAAFQEVDFGDWDGRALDTLWEEQGEALSEYWMDPVNHSPPNGESLEAMWERVQAGLQDLGEAYPGKRVLLVTHGGVIRLILAQCLGMPLANMTRFSVPFAALTRVSLSAHYPPEVLSMNGTALSP